MMDAGLGFAANMAGRRGEGRSSMLPSVSKGPFRHSAGSADTRQKLPEEPNATAASQDLSGLGDAWCFAASTEGLPLYPCSEHPQPPTSRVIPAEVAKGRAMLLLYPMIRTTDDRVFMRKRELDEASGELQQYWALVQDGDRVLVDGFSLTP